MKKGRNFDILVHALYYIEIVYMKYYKAISHKNIEYIS